MKLLRVDRESRLLFIWLGLRVGRAGVGGYFCVCEFVVCVYCGWK